MLNEQLVQGAFLTTECDGKANSMTIGWGMEGRCWNRPVFIAMVRPSRFTFELMQKAKTFTVSIPREGEMKDELMHFGKVSGRSENKFRSCGIILSDAKEITGKIIEGCEYHYECKVLFLSRWIRHVLSVRKVCSMLSIRRETIITLYSEKLFPSMIQYVKSGLFRSFLFADFTQLDSINV